MCTSMNTYVAFNPFDATNKLLVHDFAISSMRLLTMLYIVCVIVSNVRVLPLIYTLR
jgi:hypothetical protein